MLAIIFRIIAIKMNENIVNFYLTNEDYGTLFYSRTSQKNFYSYTLINDCDECFKNSIYAEKNI